MSELERLAHRVLMASFKGRTAPDWLLRRLDAGLGAVCLFANNVESVSQVGVLNASLHDHAPVLVAADEEGGDVTRLEAGTGSSWPGNAALGAIDDLTATRAAGAGIGALLREAGIDLDLAPCIDVNSNPQNPVIGVRSFGSDPDLVARHGVAFADGLRAVGVLACAKHFPGHGDTSLDSHRALPTVDAPLEVLRRRELVPFQALIAAGVPAIMTSHVRLLAFDDDQPATLSRRILVDLLREDLGYGGTIVTDALDMAAARGDRTLAATAVASLRAGADLLCLGARQDEDVVDAVVSALTAAVRSGELSAEHLDGASRRVDALVARRADHVDACMPPVGADGVELAARALRVSGPVGAVRAAHVVTLDPEPCVAAGRVPWGVAAPLARVDPNTTAVTVTAGDAMNPSVPAELSAAATGRPFVVVTRDVHRHAWQRDLLDRLVPLRPDLVHVEMGWPGNGGPAAGPAGVTTLITFGASRASGEAAARRLTGPRP
jgi:beta-N-acetylhexosaminidase